MKLALCQVVPVAGAIADKVTTVQVAAGQKVFKAAQAACIAADSPLRSDKVGFARAVLYCLEYEADPELRTTAMANFEQLFTVISKAQRQAIRSNSRERVRRTLTRYKNAFLRDHPASALRRDAEALLEDIENQLTEVNEETEQVRASIRMIRNDFKLAEEPSASIDDYESFKARLESLPYGGLQAVQAPPIA